MDPELWGPKLWFFLHTISFEYNPSIETKKSYSTFFNSLAPIIPCEICRLHYTKFLKNNPIENSLDNKESLIKWVLKCHNNVNKINNKPEWSYNDLMSKYTSIFKNDLYNKLSYKNISIFLFIIILLLILFILIK
jgi:hypothetical protein